VQARVQDPVTAELIAPLSPPHPFGAKRPSLEQWYYEVFNQENATLVDIKKNPIAEILPQGVRRSEDIYDLGLLILATEFAAGTGGFTQIDLRGTSGLTLKEIWQDGVDTQLGLAVPEFPNLLMPLADSWYMGANIPGKQRQMLFYMGSTAYMAHCNESAETGYAGFKLR